MFLTGLATSSSKLRRALYAPWSAWSVTLVVATGAAVGAGFSTSVEARETQQSSIGVVALSELPPQAQETHRLVLSGGPYPYAKDGTVFGNRERLLPRQARGYYREYTVKTPGSKDRGARRLVCGGEPPSKPEVCFYTADHYASFRRIAP